MTEDRHRRRYRRRRKSGDTNSLQARAPMDVNPHLREPPHTPEQESRAIRVDRISGIVLSLLAVAWLLTRRTQSLEWIAPYLFGALCLSFDSFGALSLWANRRKIQRAIEDSDFF